MYARATAGVVEEDIQSFSVLCAGLRVLYCDSVPSMSVPAWGVQCTSNNGFGGGRSESFALYERAFLD